MGLNAYGATKAFVHQLTFNMSMDLQGTAVRVSGISPGMTPGLLQSLSKVVSRTKWSLLPMVHCERTISPMRSGEASRLATVGVGAVVELRARLR